MDSIANWLSDWREIAANQLQDLLAYLPNLLGAMALLVLAFLAARLARSVVQRVGNGINDVLDRVLSQGGHMDRVRLSAGALRVAETIVYWIAVLFFVAEAASVAKLETFASWLDRIVEFIPSIVGAGVIILAGYVISTLVRDVVVASMPTPGAEGEDAEVNVPAFIAQGATFLFAVVIGIDQVGIDVTFLITFIAIALGGTLLSLAVAFGLGARALVSNLIGARDLRRHYSPGQTVRIGAVDGEILELTSTSVIIATDDGRVIVPAKVFHEQNTTLVVPPL